MLLLALLTACGRHDEDSKGSTDTAVDSGDTGETGHTGETQETDTQQPLDSGCDPSAEIVLPLVPDGADPILVFDATVDPVGRRAWSTALVTPTLAEIDIDTQTLVKVHTLSATKFDRPQVSVAGDGAPWVASGEGDAITRLDPVSGVVTHPLSDMERATSVIGRPDGGAWVAGEIATHPVLVWLDADGDVITQVDLDDPALGLTATNDGGVAALVSDDDGSGGQAIEVFDGDTLEMQTTCVSPPTDKFFSQIADGSFITGSETTINRVPCDGVTEPTTIREGQDNKEFIPYEDGFVVLDRVGDDRTDGYNWGQVRYYDNELNWTGQIFVSGKHTGYGGLDPTTGIVWANSEGTTSVYGLDLVHEQAVANVQVGLNIETLLPDPRYPGEMIVTGRLSGTVARVDLCENSYVEAAEAPTWPVSPVLVGDTLYTIDQLTGMIQVWNADTLEWLDTYDFSLPDNTLLNFDYMVYHPTRHTLFMTETVDNVLMEIDPDTGDVLHQWVLSGKPITDTGTITRSEVELVDGWLFVARPQDGQLTLVDPDEDEPVAEATMDKQTIKIINTNRLDLVWVTADDSAVYVGPIAFDPDTLSPTGVELGQGAESVFADDGEGGVWAYSYEDQVVRRYDEDGKAGVDFPAIVSDQGEPSFHLVDVWGGRLLYSDFEHATIHAVSLE